METLGLVAVLALLAVIPHMSVPFLTFLAAWVLPRDPTLAGRASLAATLVTE